MCVRLCVCIMITRYVCCVSLDLLNDHKALMKKIEEGLHKIHAASTATDGEQLASDTSSSSETETLEPFLRVNVVSPGSPAEIAVCCCVISTIHFVDLVCRNFTC